MDSSVMQKIIDLQTEITKRDDLIAKLEVFIMLESKKRKGLMDAFYQDFKDTDIFLKRQPKKQTKSKTNEGFAMHNNLNILAEFYPDTLALIAKKYGFKIGEFRYQVMQNGVFLNQSDIELIDSLVAEHYAAKRKI